MSTRTIHVVRITNPQTSSLFLDVAVLDKIAFQRGDGTEVVYDVSPTNVVPYIKDPTGDLGDVGDPNDCSRVSHLKRITYGVGKNGDAYAGNESNRPNYMFDAEVLDAFTLRTTRSMSSEDEESFIIPVDKAVITVTDNTGNGLDDSPNSPTRAAHISELDVNSTPSDEGGTTGNPDGLCIIIQKTDAIAVQSTNGIEALLYMPWSGADINDITQYDDNGDPPENADPNPYIVWPMGSVGPWTGNGGVDTNAPDPDFCPVVDQGPLWWIKNANPGPQWWMIRQDFEVTSITPPNPVGQPYETDGPDMPSIYGEPIPMYGPMLSTTFPSSWPEEPEDPIGGTGSQQPSVPPSSSVKVRVSWTTANKIMGPLPRVKNLSYWDFTNVSIWAFWWVVSYVFNSVDGLDYQVPGDWTDFFYGPGPVSFPPFTQTLTAYDANNNVLMTYTLQQNIPNVGTIGTDYYEGNGFFYGTLKEVQNAYPGYSVVPFSSM
jgi:hypothetical protein